MGVLLRVRAVVIAAAAWPILVMATKVSLILRLVLVTMWFCARTSNT